MRQEESSNEWRDDDKRVINAWLAFPQRLSNHLMRAGVNLMLQPRLRRLYAFQTHITVPMSTWMKQVVAISNSEPEFPFISMHDMMHSRPLNFLDNFSAVHYIIFMLEVPQLSNYNKQWQLYQP